jgi:hypothetical protein
MKKIIFTIALFVVSNCILASEDVVIKYYSKVQFKELSKNDSNKAKDIQIKLHKIDLYDSDIDGEWGEGVKEAFDTIKARLAFMNKDISNDYVDSEYKKKISPRLVVNKGNEDNTEISDGKEEKNNNTLIIVIVLLLVLNLIYLIFKQKIDSKVINLINNDIVSQNNLDEKNNINIENESLKSKNESLKSKVKILELKIQNLESNAVIVKSEEKESEIQFKNEVIFETIKEKIVYAQIPDNDIFNRISDNILNSNFVFKLIVNENNAEFNFIENDKNTINLLKSDPETYIVPFFQKKGLVTSNFKITKPGKAKLENGKWRIIEKGTVEFY